MLAEGKLVARLALLVAQGAVALSAIGGGVTLVVASLAGSTDRLLVPSPAYLSGSPFDSYVVPGIVLAVVIGGLHGVAALRGLVGAPWAALLSAVAAFALLIWIFVQMVLVPYSALQAVYEGVAILELALVLVGAGVLDDLLLHR